MSRASQSARHSFKKMAGCSRRGVAARRSNFDGSCGKQARRPKDRSAGRKCPGSTALKMGRRVEISSCRHQGTLRGVGAGRPARYRRRRPLLARLLHGSSLRHHHPPSLGYLAPRAAGRHQPAMAMCANASVRKRCLNADQIGLQGGSFLVLCKDNGHRCYVRDQTFPCEMAVLQLFIGLSSSELALLSLARA